MSPLKNNEKIKTMHQHYAAFMLDWNRRKQYGTLTNVALSLGCALKKVGLIKDFYLRYCGRRHILYSVFRNFLRGRICFYGQGWVFNQYSMHYFFKLFLERVLEKNPSWNWNNTIMLDNSEV